GHISPSASPQLVTLDQLRSCEKKRDPGLWMASSLSAESAASAGSDDADAADAGEGVCVRSTSRSLLTAPSMSMMRPASIPGTDRVTKQEGGLTCLDRKSTR